MILQRCISLLCLVGTAKCIFDSTLPPGLFYPFGTDRGDNIVTPSDDGGSGSLAISNDLPFYNRTYNNLHVMMNGLITFEREINLYTPVALSTLDSSYVMIAPYWSDVITSADGAYGPGRVYYRNLTNKFCKQSGTPESHTNDSSLLTATYDIRSNFNYLSYTTFEACWMLIATWHNVTFYGGSRTSPTNTFQAVLITDWENSFVIFNYGKLQWTCGTNSGCNLSGLGGRGAALVGYKSCCNYTAVGWSMTDQVLFMVNTSNVGKSGRWAWQIGQSSENSTCRPAVIDMGEQCELVYQNNSRGTGCQDIAPPFTCPTLSGPTVIDRLWVEFYCTVNTNVIDPAARFEVTFLFDEASANDVPVFIATVDNPRVTLHEMYLYGKLNKRLSCQVVSYWSSTSNQKSRALLSFSPSYYLGIQATNYDIHVAESDLNPKTVVLRSTIPITCSSGSLANQSTPCSLSLAIVAGAQLNNITDVAVRQRYPGLDPTENSCVYIIKDSDWKADEKLAYNNDGKLEIIAQIDPFITGPRATQLEISFPAIINKTVNSKTYINPWSGYVMKNNLLVYHYDSREAVSTCYSSGDPHLTTFDGLQYSTYGTGTFIYAQSQSGLPLEVQVRHKPCYQGATVTCICAIALREDNVIVAIDTCDGDFHAISYNGKNLPSASGIFTDGSTHRYKLQVPSGTRVYGDLYPGFINMHLTVVGKRQLQGFCGSPNGNVTDEVTIKGTNQVVPITELIPGFVGPLLPDRVVNSWSVPLGSTLFDGVVSTLPRGDPVAESVLTYCHCSKTKTTCGGPAVSLPMFPKDPDIYVPPGQPTNNKPAGRRRRRADENDGIQISTGDYIDSTYDPMNFPPTSVNNVNPVISSSAISAANATCWSKVMDVAYLGTPCKVSIRPFDAQAIVAKCIKDIVLTNDAKWADDKIAEVQKTCYFDQITKNNSDINDPVLAIQKALNDVQQITSNTCSPFDCSGHGRCFNGACVCSTDYIGEDCGVLKTAVPYVDKVIDPIDCDVTSRPCLMASLKTTNAAGVNSLKCRIRVSYLNGTTETYDRRAVRTSLSSVVCKLPAGPLLYIDSTFNFRSKYSNGMDFNCVSPGSPVITYSISVSNDGRSFGNEKTIRLINKSCYNCNSSGCAQLPNTCLINGYCFKDQDRNPLQNSCSWCRPSQSSTSWTPILDDHVTSCMMSNSCTSTSTATSTSTSTATTTSTTTTTTKPTTTTTPSQTSTTTTVTTTATLPSTTLPTNRCGSWRVFEDQHSSGGNRQSNINNLNDCLTRCVNDVTCSAVDYSFQASADSRCWHFNARTGYQGVRNPMGGTNQYVLTIDGCSCNSSSSSLPSTQSTRRCDSSPWQVYADRHSNYGDRQSDITNLNDCLNRCRGTNQCDAVDFNAMESPGYQCWFHSNANGFSTSRSPLTGTHQYVISPNWCSCNETPIPTSVRTRHTPTTSTTTTTTTTAPCVEVWAEYADQNSFYGVARPGANNLAACKRSCINDVRCLAIDFTPEDSPDSRCWFHLDADFAETRGSWSGTTQYVIMKRCN